MRAPQRRPAGGSTAGVLLAYDDFNRADGLLGTADSGQAWTYGGGSDWGIASGAARPNAITSGIVAWVPIPTPDVYVSAVLNSLGFCSLIARAQSFGNYYIVSVQSSTLRLFRAVSNAATQIGIATVAMPVGTRVGIRCTGTTIEALVNDVPQITTTDSTWSTAGQAGLRSGGGTITFSYDAFRVYSTS